MRLTELESQPSDDDGQFELPLLYHGTSISKARQIVAAGIRPRGKNNTFGKSTSFSNKPVGTRYYDKGAILVFEFLPMAKVISLADYQRNGRGSADAVIGGPDGHYEDREVAVFNPDAIRLLGWYNKMTDEIDSDEPVYPKGFYHRWA